MILSCNATGNPPPNVTWLKSGDQDNNVHLGSLLPLRNISRAQDGLYWCTAESKAGKSMASLRVIAQCKCQCKARTISVGEIKQRLSIHVHFIRIAWLLHLLMLFWFASEAYHGSFLKPWLLVWRGLVKPDYLGRDLSLERYFSHEFFHPQKARKINTVVSNKVFMSNNRVPVKWSSTDCKRHNFSQETLQSLRYSIGSEMLEMLCRGVYSSLGVGAREGFWQNLNSNLAKDLKGISRWVLAKNSDRSGVQ